MYMFSSYSMSKENLKKKSLISHRLTECGRKLLDFYFTTKSSHDSDALKPSLSLHLL